MSRPFLVVLLALIVACATRADAQVRQRTGQLRIRNDSTRAIYIEVRTGAQPCEQGLLIRADSVLPGRFWTISSSRPICVRREQSRTGETRTWRQWREITTVRGRTEEIGL